MTQIHPGAVGIFDSGLGMLSILPHIRQLLPQARFACLADQALFPYGNKDEALIRKRMVALIPEFVRQTRPSLIVLACNTASTSALQEIRNILTIPVVGVVPAIKPAAELSQSKITGILATSATISSPYTRQLIEAHASHCQVILQASHLLAGYAESYRLSGIRPDPELIKKELGLLIAGKPDTVALACTHFPLIREFLEPFLPGVRAWSEPGPGVAKQVKKILSDISSKTELSGPGKSLFWSTSDQFTANHQSIELLNEQRAEVSYFRFTKAGK